MLSSDSALFNLDAEQAVLGALLYENALLARLEDHIDAACFYEPVHARIWRWSAALIEAGEIADAVSLRGYGESDEGLKALGGAGYLVDLMSAGTSPAAAIAYAVIVRELSEKRSLMRIAAGLHTLARDPTTKPVEARDWIDDQLGGERTADRRSGGRVVSCETAVREAMDAYKGAIETGYPEGTVLTGVETFDAALGGMQSSHLALIAAGRGMGKSLLANLMAKGAALGAGGMEPARVLYVGCEMEGAENVFRLAAADINAAYKDISEANLSDSQFADLKKSFREIAALPITWREGGLTLPELRRLVRAEQRRAGLRLGLVIIDPVGFIRIPGITDETTWGNELAIDLKDLATSTALPIAAFHHLKKVDNRRDLRPTEGDVRGSGRWLDYCNEAVLLHRDAYYAAREPEPTPDYSKTDPAERARDHEEARARWAKRAGALEMDFLIAKRRGGPTEWCKMGCNVRTGRFWDLDVREPDFLTVSP